jgi:2-polyprenyl-3-methyl-5-hydroxy-6-metoxy-1,4-benzoquinol methylase
MTELEFAKKTDLNYYRYLLSNNYERAVFLKGDEVLPRETIRYLWANSKIDGNKVLEIGCSTGYGSQFINEGIDYLGLDYDATIVQVAKEQQWGNGRYFLHADINHFNFNCYDTIIAFEVIEHLINGLEIVEKLKTHCNRLLISVPYNEPVGFWGEHHQLHGLTEKDFPHFQFEYIDEHGHLTKQLNQQSRFSLMVCQWNAY